jgi:WD40 repeat protein
VENDVPYVPIPIDHSVIDPSIGDKEFPRVIMETNKKFLEVIYNPIKIEFYPQKNKIIVFLAVDLDPPSQKKLRNLAFVCIKPNPQGYDDVQKNTTFTVEVEHDFCPINQKTTTLSPDGEKFAFVMIEPGPIGLTKIFNFSNGKMTTLCSDAQLGRCPEFSPDGKLLINHAKQKNSIEIYDVETEKKIQVVKTEQEVAPITKPVVFLPKSLFKKLEYKYVFLLATKKEIQIWGCEY